MHQLIWNLKFGRDFIKRRDIWTKFWPYVRCVRTAIKYSGSTSNLKTHLVRWHGDNYAGDEGSVDANISNVKASTSKNTQDNNMAIKDSFQPQLSHNSERSKVITASIARFIVKDLQPHSVVESDAFRDTVSEAMPLLENCLLTYNGKWMSTHCIRLHCIASNCAKSLHI